VAGTEGGGASTRAGTDVHARAQAAFSAYFDGEISDDERRTLEQHLSVCIQCRTELTRFKATLSQLGDLRARAPSSFLADIQNQIRQRSGGRFFGGRRLLFGRIPFEWVSLAMIVAMLVYYIVTQHGSPTQVTPGP
jgi:anti-sigma factor RsiW